MTQYEYIYCAIIVHKVLNLQLKKSVILQKIFIK
jgi:hypothetical protein